MKEGSFVHVPVREAGPPALSDQASVAGQRPQPTPPRPSLSQKGIILGTRDGENPSSLREPWESPVLRRRLGVQSGARGRNEDSNPEIGGSGGQEISPGVGFWSEEQAYRLPHQLPAVCVCSLHRPASGRV